MSETALVKDANRVGLRAMIRVFNGRPIVSRRRGGARFSARRRRCSITSRKQPRVEQCMPKPFARTHARINSALGRLRAKIDARIVAGKQSVRAQTDRALLKAKSIRQACGDQITACVRRAKAAPARGKAGYKKASNWAMDREPLVAAFCYRYRRIFYLLVAACALFLIYLFWGAAVATEKSLLDPQRPDTDHATAYYAVNVVFLPSQTFLLLAAGFYAWRTLRQNHKFKQHDVEAACVRDYIAIERQLEDANGNAGKVEAAVRAYWVLMVYEYYWWQRGLISRELFATWCEFRVQNFRDPPPYKFAQASLGQNEKVPFTNYKQGFEFCKDNKVFRSPSVFYDLMLYLIGRATQHLENLQPRDIERFRHGWRQRF